jgi:hypothetical protein
MTSNTKGLGWKVLLASALFASMGAAEVMAASCKQADMKGEWLTELSTEVECMLKIDKSGAFKNAPCRPQSGGSTIGTANGKLSVSSSCKVTGNIDYKEGKTKLKITISGKMNKGKDLVSGTATSEFGSASFKSFKQ